MLGALIHCWVQLAGVSGGEKTYSGSRIIIKIYPALSLATGGRDGMDGGGGRILIIEHVINHGSRALPRCWAYWAGGFRWDKMVFST
jgi:hypothetical protein